MQQYYFEVHSEIIDTTSSTKTKDLFISLRFNYFKVFTLGVQIDTILSSLICTLWATAPNKYVFRPHTMMFFNRKKTYPLRSAVCVKVGEPLSSFCTWKILTRWSEEHVAKDVPEWSNLTSCCTEYISPSENWSNAAFFGSKIVKSYHEILMAGIDSAQNLNRRILSVQHGLQTRRRWLVNSDLFTC